MYKAVCYIGREYIPGDILPDDLPDETLERLLKSGAIRETAPAPAAPAHAPTDEPAEAPEPPAEASPEASDEPADEIDDEAEVPEIDVMDGLVAAEPPKRPRKSTRKRTKGGGEPA